MKNNFLVLLILLSCNGFSQQQNLITKSEDYYNKLQKYSIVVSFKNLSAIATDTSSFSEIFYIDKHDKTSLFLSSNNSGLFVKKDNVYIVDFNKGTYQQLKQKEIKYTGYNQYKAMPTGNAKEFFSALSTDSYDVMEVDSTLSITKSAKRYFFRKTDYSLQKIITSILDPVFKTNYYQQIFFDPINFNLTEIDSILNEASTIIMDQANESSEQKEKFRPVFFDRTLVEKNGLDIRNGKVSTFNGKWIFFDFFYEGCYPCLKAHPIVNRIYNEADTNLVVIGVDANLKDTLNILKYAARHNVQHPIILGEDAVRISQSLSVSVWPTFILIDPSGKVINYRRGFSAAFLNKIRKINFQ